GKGDMSRRAYDHLLEREPNMIRGQLLTLAAVMKRHGRREEAVRLWRHAAEEADEAGFRLKSAAVGEPYLELAMYSEHNWKKHAEALRYAMQAKETLLGRLSLSRREPKLREQLAALDKRIERLRRKADSPFDGGARYTDLYAGKLF